MTQHSFLPTTLFTLYVVTDEEVGKTSEVRISGCPSTSCVMKKGTNITIEVNFTLKSDVKRLKNSVFAILGTKAVQLPEPNPDACTGKSLSCPLKNGQKYTYKTVTSIPTTFSNFVYSYQNGNSFRCGIQ